MTSRLTERQRQVLRLRALGWRNKEIAQELGVSTQTVKRHNKATYDIFGCENLPEVLIAVGWLSIPEEIDA